MTEVNTVPPTKLSIQDVCALYGLDNVVKNVDPKIMEVVKHNEAINPNFMYDFKQWGQFATEMELFKIVGMKSYNEIYGIIELALQNDPETHFRDIINTIVCTEKYIEPTDSETIKLLKDLFVKMGGKIVIKEN